jgi:MFS family permease
MITRLRSATSDYPRQFWVLFWGLLINSIGGGMVWPFLTIFMRQQLGVPLMTVTLLFTLNSAAGLAAMSVAGPAVDRFGRRFAMIIGLVAGGSILLAMSAAQTLPIWALLMLLQGFFSPFYSVGSNAMVADLIPPARRAGAYALLRMINNLGVAIGPAIGGFVAGVSYNLAFYIAAAANLLFVTLILLFVRETLPTRAPVIANEAKQSRSSRMRLQRRVAARKDDGASTPRDGGYGPVLRDRPFVTLCGVFVLATIPASIMMMLLAAFAKENFGVPESQYGFIMATNAAMVVLFQYAVTRRSQLYPPLRVLALGALFYALGAGSVALGHGFWGFWLSMVILTCGELLIAPTGTALAATLAPPDMRGRYMGLYGITWGVSFGIGPLIGGYLNDNVAPVAIWIFGLAAGLAAVAGFLLLSRRLAGRAAYAGQGGGVLLDSGTGAEQAVEESVQ